MSGRRPGQRQRAAFRPAAGTVRSAVPSRPQALVLVLALVLVAGAIAVASFAVRPSKARAFDLFYGSLYIDDNTAPVAVDLATGKPSVRLTNAYSQVSAKTSGDLDVLPLDGGTLLLDSATGEFNMLDSTGFVLKSTGGGVSLPNATDTVRATGVAAGSSAYIVRSSGTGTSVYLVGPATVSAAVSGGRTQARASASMPQQVAGDVATTAVSARDGSDPGASSDLWLLVGSGGAHTIRQLSVPAGTNAGATLTSRDHGSVHGVAAMAVATADDAGSDTGGDVVAAASAGGIEIFDGTGRVGHLDVAAPPGVDAILPASNQRGTFAFLYHARSGWSLVRANADGTGPAVVTPLPAITGTALAPPAQSGGALYTMDRHSGALWRITLAGQVTPVPGAPQYPLVHGESSAFGQATVIARNTRVIFNSRANLEALTVFTDGSHEPVVIDKRTAVDLNSDGAAVLANLPEKAPHPTTPAHDERTSTAPKPNPGEPVTDRIDCKNTTQIPHIPAVQLVSKGSRSVQISWTYPLLDRQDCAPSTYTVSVQLAGGDAPKPPGTVRVQGVTGVNLTGLFPDTEYRIVVDAYINGKHTPSQPLLVRTQVEGPAAPTNLHVSSDDQGDWEVSWDSCGGITQGCVPVDSWTIIPQLCDAAGGLISAPANGHLVGDPSTHSFSYTYRGGTGLLGMGLRFTVEGVGDHGTIGDPTTGESCVHSWAHPIADDIHVTASTPPRTNQGGTSSTRVTVSFTGDEATALGGVGGTLTYRLLSGGSLVTQKGPTTDSNVVLSGVRPGSAYQVQVIATPPGHPTASVALDPVDVQAAVANWPALDASASFAADPAPSATGTLTVTVDGLTSADARGEHFDLADSSQLRCGNTAMPLQASGLDLTKPLTFAHIDRSQFNGVCSVQLALTEDPATVRTPAYFGGITSPAVDGGTVLLPVPNLDTSAAQFTANFVSGGILSPPQLAVAYHGGNPLIGEYAGGWNVQAQYDAGGTWTACGAPSTANPAQSPAVLNLNTACYYANYSDAWRVTVTFSYFGQSPSAPYAIDVDSSTKPQPVDPAQMSFTGAWSAGSIAVSYSGPYSDAQLAQLNWTESVSSDHGSGCASATQPPSNTSPITLSVDTTACPTSATSTPPPPAPVPPSGSGAPSGSASSSGSSSAAPPAPVVTPTTYTVTISFSDPDYGTTGTYTVTVTAS